MIVTATETLPEVLVVEPRRFGDERGYFLETWSRDRYAEAALPATFVQDNLSRSRHGVLRGLHLQHPRAQGKLVSVLVGEVFDVAVDVRRGSPTFGRWVGEYLSEQDHRQLYVPEGFAHGFLVLSEFAIFHYKCTEPYSATAEVGIAWDDPTLGIAWPLERLRGSVDLSPKDASAKRLTAIPAERLPTWKSPS